jgi:hypothetical protein
MQGSAEHGQEPFINQNLAYQALGILTQLLRHGSLSYQGGFCNLATGQLVPTPIRQVKSHSPNDRLVIALHSPDGILQTGPSVAPPEKEPQSMPASSSRELSPSPV